MPGKDERKIDRRVIKTKRAILDAFMGLVATMPYEKITISALAREANIDRKTFYLHYASIDDLLEDVMEQKLEEMLGEDSESRFADDGSALSFLTHINHAYHRTLAANGALLKNLSSAAVLKATRSVLMRKVLETSTFAEDQDADKLALNAAFFLYGVAGAYKHALAARPDDDFEDISKDIEAVSLSFLETQLAELDQKHQEDFPKERRSDAHETVHRRLDAVRI